MWNHSLWAVDTVLNEASNGSAGDGIWIIDAFTHCDGVGVGGGVVTPYSEGDTRLLRMGRAVCFGSIDVGVIKGCLVVE